MSSQTARMMHEERRKRIQSTMLYASSVLITFVGLSFAAVPLYQ